jgi:argininosuccinate synthase
LHEGHFLDPLARDLEAFLVSSQSVVSGDVRLQLRPNSFNVEGVRSPHSLMRADVASYGESTALCFARIFGVPQMLAVSARQEETK